MKSETRILVSTCKDPLCAAFVLRGDSVDGVAIGIGCIGLCLRLSEEGFLGELRYAIGKCNCGLPNPPMNVKTVDDYMALLEKILMKIDKVLDLARNVKTFNPNNI